MTNVFPAAGKQHLFMCCRSQKEELCRKQLNVFNLHIILKENV